MFLPSVSPIDAPGFGFSFLISVLSAGGLLEQDCAWVNWEDGTNKGNPLYEFNIRQLNESLRKEKFLNSSE